MEPAEGARVIRTSVSVTRLDHVRHVRLRGEGAYEAVDRLIPRELYIRDGQLSLSLLLNEGGTVFADCYVGSDEGEFFLLAEGPAEDELVRHIRAHSRDLEDLEVAAMDATHGMIGLNGPYAWELMARLVGPEVIGLPFLTFFHFEGIACCRVGKTGEYGYVLIAERDAMDGLWDELVRLGGSLDAAEADLEALDACALESWFFNIRGEGRHEVTPLELQLQWRISRRKTAVGSDSLLRRRREGVRRRLTCLRGRARMAAGDVVSFEGHDIGTVLHAVAETMGDGWVASALIDVELAVPWIDGLAVGKSGVAARSVTPPVVNNRSLYVNPQVHSYASRGQDDFPPIIA